MTSLLGLAFGALIAYLGYREAAKHQAQYGRPPWGVSPLVWAFIVLFTGLILGGILLWAARRSDRNKVAPVAADWTAGAPVPQGPLPQAALRSSALSTVPSRRRAPAGKGRPGSVL